MRPPVLQRELLFHVQSRVPHWWSPSLHFTVCFLQCWWRRVFRMAQWSSLTFVAELERDPGWFQRLWSCLIRLLFRSCVLILHYTQALSQVRACLIHAANRNQNSLLLHRNVNKRCFFFFEIIFVPVSWRFSSAALQLVIQTNSK